MINGYLQGQLEQDDHAIHLLFSANRWEAAESLKSHLSSGVNVIVDRYSYSGAVYSAAKENPTLSLEWAWQPEVGLPRPDLLLFLALSLEASTKRGGYGQERYETNKMQGNVSRLFKSLLRMNHGHSVETIEAGASVEEVAQIVLKHALASLATRNASDRVEQLRSWRELQEHLTPAVCDSSSI
jgi:dTMP kinase